LIILCYITCLEICGVTQLSDHEGHYTVFYHLLKLVSQHHLKQISVRFAGGRRKSSISLSGAALCYDLCRLCDPGLLLAAQIRYAASFKPKKDGYQ